MLPRAKHTLTLFLVVLLASTLATAGLAAGPSPAGAPLNARSQAPGPRLLSSTEAGLIFEVTVPWQQLALEPVTAHGKDYLRVSLPGWASTSQAGAPALPLLAQAIGVPFGAALSVDVQPGQTHTQTLPAPALQVTTQSVEQKIFDAAEGLPALPALPTSGPSR